MRFARTAPVAVAALGALALAAPAGAAPATVVVNNKSFGPKSVTINSGDTITWDFQEGGHNAVSTDAPASFDSRPAGKSTNSSGTTWSTTLTKPGVYKYVCTEHSSMTASVTVVDAPPPSGGGSTGGGSTGGGSTGSGSTGGGSTGSGGTGTGSTGSGSTATGGSTGAGSTATGGSAGSDAASTGAAQTSAPSVDAAAPSLKRLRFRANTLQLLLSEDARVVVRYTRVGAKRHVAKKVVRGKKGALTLRLRRWMRPGRYRLTIVAIDAAGNASRPARRTVTIRR